MNRKTKRILPLLQTKEYCLATKKNQVVTHAVCTVLSHSVVSNSLSPRDCSPPGSSVHGDPPGKNTEVGCHALLQGIFSTQGSNPGLLHHRWILQQHQTLGQIISAPFSDVGPDREFYKQRPEFEIGDSLHLLAKASTLSS